MNDWCCCSLHRAIAAESSSLAPMLPAAGIAPRLCRMDMEYAYDAHSRESLGSATSAPSWCTAVGLLGITP